MLDTSIKVKTDHFDGPLSLLLLLIQKEQMDIRDLELTTITKQYLDYLQEMRELNFDIAGEYLYLAATLLLIKSKNCLNDEDLDALSDKFGTGELTITSQAELIRRLEELKRFQNIGQLLWILPKKGHETFVKPKINRKEIINSILTPMDLSKLTLSMMEFLSKERRKYTVIHRDRLSIKEKLVFLKSHLKIGDQTQLNTLVEADGGIDLDNIVITFISLLELARLQKVKVFQNEDRGEIYVETVGNLDEFDVDTATGFDEENEEEEFPTLEVKETTSVEVADGKEEIMKEEVKAYIKFDTETVQ